MCLFGVEGEGGDDVEREGREGMGEWDGGEGEGEEKKTPDFKKPVISTYLLFPFTC